jgi:hypothetical protein
MVRWSLSFVSLSLLLSGCVAQELQVAYSNEFNCPDHQVKVQELGAERYRVSGCNKSVVYQCFGDHCGLDREEQAASARPAPTRQPPAAALPEPQQKAAAVSERKGREGVLVSADVPIGQKSLLKLRAAPGEQSELVQIKLAVMEPEETLDDCDLELMLNGQRMPPTKTRFTRTGVLSNLLINVPRDVVTELGVARQLALRACERRWSLSDEALYEVRNFVQRYEEELVWLGDAKRGKTGGLLAPSGGWPAWSASALPPPSKQQAPLEGSALFELLAPSVFIVESLVSNGSRQGSAVAVSPTELVTNCHVLDGARKVLLKQKGREWVAKILRADPASDRCVISVPDQTFVPVRGVRAYTELKVGESLYTLGSPNGLELTLSSGILSAVREEEGRRYVQTTAPISPGSSGGGLFDAYGNLVGVTTLVLAGRERLNQSLNFAIPADAYFQL